MKQKTPIRDRALLKIVEFIFHKLTPETERIVRDMYAVGRNGAHERWAERNGVYSDGIDPFEDQDETDPDLKHVGEVGVMCPDCGVVVNVPVSARLATDEEGQQFLDCDSDLADLWAHAWTHDGGDS